jgi:hypothetical protein
MFKTQFCTTCLKRVRSPNHVCQPSAIEKARWMKDFGQKRQQGKSRGE